MALRHSYLPVVFVALALTACSSTADSGGESESADELRRGQTLLRIPLLDGQGELLSSHNAELASKGLAPITADFIEFDSSRPETGLAKWWAASAIVDDAQVKGLDLEMRSLGEPHEYVRHDAKGMCWKGQAKKAVELVSRLSDAVFSDQLTVHGWRYKAQKELADNVDDSAMPTIWNQWRGTGEAILMITASSDDGGETNVGLIPKCR